MHNACIVCPKTTTGRIVSGFLSRSVAKAEWESTQKRECFNASTDTTSDWSRITENSSTWKNQMLCPWNSPYEVVLGRLGGLGTNSKQKNTSSPQSLGLLAQPKEGAAGKPPVLCALPLLRPPRLSGAGRAAVRIGSPGCSVFALGSVPQHWHFPGRHIFARLNV